MRKDASSDRAICGIAESIAVPLMVPSYQPAGTVIFNVSFGFTKLYPLMVMRGEAGRTAISAAFFCSPPCHLRR